MLKYIFLISFLLCGISVAEESKSVTAHAISMFGKIKYKKDFKNFDYVNPNAPKVGKVRLAAQGTFDSLNPFILKGLSAAGINLIYDSLLTSALDEPFTEYSKIASSVSVSKDNSWVEFTINPKAVWHDGLPITPEDIIWTFNTLIVKGHPWYRSYYEGVKSVKKTSKQTVKFIFKQNTINRELPLIIGQLQPLPKHYWEKRIFEETTLEPPIGSGPYKILNLDPGHSIVYERVKDYWGANLPVNVGHHNFNIIQYDYYRDANVMIEALKAQEYDFRSENISKEWSTAYNIPELKSGLLKKELVKNYLPQGMQGFAFNIRKPIFQDIELRKAINYAFDFEWTNKTLFYDQYTRSESYFSNSSLASNSIPKGLELEILEEIRDLLPESLFKTPFMVPKTDGSGRNRKNLKIARDILEKSSYKIYDSLLHSPNNLPVEFEILLVSPAFEKIVGPFKENLKKLGIKTTIRIVDPAQYKNRLDQFDYDMIVFAIGQSLSPGNEQKNYWSSKAADIPGSSNWIGIKNKAVDHLIKKIIQSPDEETLISSTKALDRVLLHGYYVVPHWHIDSARLVYWNKFSHPKKLPPFGHGFPEIWWWNNTKAMSFTNGIKDD